MNRRKLSKIRQQIEVYRRCGGIKSGDMEALAGSLDRVKSKRGKEPTWISAKFPELYPLSIPHHGSRDLNKFTAGSILDQLENDLERREEVIGSEEEGN